MNNLMDNLLAGASGIIIILAIMWAGCADARDDVRYCRKNGSDEIIIVRAPNLCPPGTQPL